MPTIDRWENSKRGLDDRYKKRDGFISISFNYRAISPVELAKRAKH